MADEDIGDDLLQQEEEATTQYYGKLPPDVFETSYKLLVNEEGTALRLKGKSSKVFGVNGTPEGRTAKAQRVLNQWFPEHLDAPNVCKSHQVIHLFDRGHSQGSNQYIAACSGNSILFHLGCVYEVQVS
jgi:hypothetical protein